MKQSTQKPLEAVLGDLVSLGYGNFIVWRRVLGVLAPRRQAGRELLERAERAGRLLKVGPGHRARALILTDSDHVFLIPASVAEMQARLEKAREAAPC